MVCAYCKQEIPDGWVRYRNPLTHHEYHFVCAPDSREMERITIAAALLRYRGED